MVLRSYCDDEENDMVFKVLCRRRKALDIGRKKVDAGLAVMSCKLVVETEYNTLEQTIGEVV